MDEQQPYGFIYLTTCSANGKKYIGQRRYHPAKPASDEAYMGSGRIVVLAIKKHGLSCFSKVHLQECYSEEELNQAEIDWIARLGALSSDSYYNIAAGGSFGDTWTGQSEEKRRAFSKRIAESNHTRKLPEDFNRGEKNAAFGRKWFKNLETMDEYFLKPDDPDIARLGLVPGKFRTAEHNAKIGAAHRGKKKNYVNGAAGKKWMNDGHRNFYVEPAEIKSFLSRGFKLGLARLGKMQKQQL